MYHIKDDIRAYKLAELIYQGILTLLQSREFSKITISDIQRVSFVGRSTFYRSFDAPIDVLQWKCESAFKKMMEDYTQLPHHDQENNEFLCYFFGYWMTNYQILDILSQIGRYDIIFPTIDLIVNSIEKQIYKETETNKTEELTKKLDDWKKQAKETTERKNNLELTHYPTKI